MLPDWHKLLAFFLWIAPHVLLGLLAVIICKRRLYRVFPCFFAYVLYEIVEFILLFALRSARSVTEEEYMYAYYATLGLSIALRFGVIDEVSKHLFRDSQFLKVAAKRLLQCVTGLLVIAGVLLAVYAHGDVRRIAGLSVVSRGAAMVQCGLLLFLLFFSRFLGLTWRRPAFGIALGLGILTSVDLAVHAVRTELSSDVWVPYLDLLATAAYLICVLTWIGYLLLPETKIASAGVIPYNDEVETWNKDLQYLLRK